jgi:DNA-binding NarL/FixJ family response regulator
MIGETGTGRDVLLADADGAARSAIVSLLEGLGSRVTTVSSGTELLAAVAGWPTAVVLLAVDLQDPCGFEVLHRLRLSYGSALTIALFAAANDATPRDEVAALLLGADDYFSWPLLADTFVARIRRLLGHPNGGSARSPEVAAGRPELTRREREVLTLLVQGLRRPAIADRLCISHKTVATHIEHILRKLGAHNQAQAVAFAVRDGIVGASAP